MSVQALILVPDPFFNEPGYERIRGTPEGDKQAREYNEVIREATIRHAMIDNMRKPPPELREAILSHFALRRDAILANLHAMAAEKANSKPHAARMGTLIKQLEEAFDTYAPPSVLSQT
jgi:baculoviral IAP repeat-containing protein 6